MRPSQELRLALAAAVVLAAAGATSSSAHAQPDGVVIVNDPQWIASAQNNSLHASSQTRVGILTDYKPLAPLHVGQSTNLKTALTSNELLGGGVLVGNRAHQESLVSISREGVQGYVGYSCSAAEPCLNAYQLTLQPFGFDLNVGGPMNVAGPVDVAGTLWTDRLGAPVYVESSGDTTANTYNGPFVVGVQSGNVAIDGNEIMARANGAPATLHLNAEGGPVIVHGHADMPNTAAVVFHDDGRVRIGRANSLYHAEVKLSVEGTIVADEVLVTPNGWPDYVFEDGYPLPQLADVERHIAERGHLPGVPSAEEVRQRGVGVGDMQKRLLEKIEELTLHLIEQERRLQRLEARCGS